MSSSPGLPDRERGASRRRRLGYAAVVALCVAGAAGYATHAVWRARAAAAVPMPMPAVALARLPDTEPSGRPAPLFRNTALGEAFGRLSLETLAAARGPRGVAPMSCERVHFAAGHGVCLEARRSALTTYHAHVFDRSFKVLHTQALAGPPSRARMSPDGRLAAVTVFVSGHSYASPGFTTRSSVIDVASGQFVVEDLEKLQVLRDGQPFSAADFNFWGLTFGRDGNRFHATLGTGGKQLLVQGDLAARRMQVIHADVECPSLSPDGTRIAFKRRIADDGDGRFRWRLHVLELASGQVTPLPLEARSVDDQVEWLDDREIAYALPDDAAQATAATNTWALAVDGASPPRLLMPLSFSPVAMR